VDDPEDRNRPISVRIRRACRHSGDGGWFSVAEQRRIFDANAAAVLEPCRTATQNY
jgi:hypothetical protein